MTRFEVSFPDEWATVPADGAPGPAAVGTPGGALPALDAESWRVDVAAVLTVPADCETAGVTALRMPGDEPGGPVRALCAVVVVHAGSAGPADLRRIAESGPHPGLERDTTEVALPAGDAVRSAAFRFAEELLDDEGVAPYAGEVRFAIALPGRRIGILHFETLSLVHFDELAGLFDAIAETARVA